MDLFESAVAEGEETEDAIMRATFRALCDHGYADLTIQAIADEFEKSKSLLYYHYETKDELLLDFLAYMLEHFERTHNTVDPEVDAVEQLQAWLDGPLPRTLEEGRRDFFTAMFELRVKAHHDEAYREQFARSDRVMRETIADHIELGIDRGDFRTVDVEETAALIQAVIFGSTLRWLTTGEEAAVAEARSALDAYVDSHLEHGGTVDA